MSQFATLWFWREGPLDDTWFRVESFSTDEYPKPSTVVGGPRPSDAPAFSWSTLDDSGRLCIRTVTEHLPNAPDLWWILKDEPHPLSPTVSLIAFADGMFPDGTVLTVEQARAVGGLGPRMQAAAIRWGKGDPKLEQIYVNPDYRRRRMSIKMINVADIVNEASGWGGYIYGGAELTPDGEKLAQAWSHSPRLRPQTVAHTPLEPDPSQP